MAKKVSLLAQLLLLLLHSTASVTSVASLSVSPDRSHFFEYESVSLSCVEQQGSSTGWRVRRYSASVKLSDCGTDWGSVEGYTCFINAISSDSGEYWCESVSGQHSSAVNITVTAGDVILESPVLPVTEGEAVTLRCRYNKTPSNLTTDFYKDGSLIRTESTGEMTIPAVFKSDEGLYKCHISDLGESPESWLAVRDSSPPASLSVSPDRSQFFEYESVFLSCVEQQGSSTAWRVRRYSASGKLSDCGADWGTLHGLDCSTHIINGDSGVYWCESVSGERSNTANITVQTGAVILDPVLPVTEGEAVTLSCRYKTTPSNLTTDFYKDGSLIRTASKGEMTIPAVSKSDEGLYKCHHFDLGESPESWLAVRDPPPLPPPSPTSPPAPIMSLHRLICHLVVACPYLLCTIILGVKYHRRGQGSSTKQ